MKQTSQDPPYVITEREKNEKPKGSFFKSFSFLDENKQVLVAFFLLVFLTSSVVVVSSYVSNQQRSFSSGSQARQVIFPTPTIFQTSVTPPSYRRITPTPTLKLSPSITRSLSPTPLPTANTPSAGQ